MFATWLFAALEVATPVEMEDEYVSLITSGESKGKPTRILHAIIQQGEFDLPFQKKVEFEDQLIEISPDGSAEVVQHFKTTPVPADTHISKTLRFPPTVFSLVEEFDTSGF